MINGDVEKVQRYFFIITARGTGKTTTLLMMIGYFCYDYPFVINIIKKTWTKILEFMEQLTEIMQEVFGITVKFNQSKRRMVFGKSIIRVFTLNKEHMKQKEVPTGISIEYTKKAVINIVDECSPDIDYSLWSVFEQSQKAGEDQVPKTTFFMSNPWVRGDYFISKWFKNTGWNRNDGMKAPYYKEVSVGKTTYIGASLFANPMCPDTDLQTYWDTTEFNKNQRNIVIFGIPGASNGQVFDSFYNMHFEDWGTDFTTVYGGIDIGWTTVAGEGGATTMELFKFDSHKGLQGFCEYYHHNKEGFIDGIRQQSLMLNQLHNALNKLNKPGITCLIRVDCGADSTTAQHFQQEWNTKWANTTSARVFFQAMTTSMKLKWKLKDRYDWINQCLAQSFIQIDDKLQPHLYVDLESAVYKDTTINIEKDPTMEHDFSDTIMGICYASAGFQLSWLNGWKMWKKKQEQMKKNLAVMSEKSISPSTKSMVN